MKREIRETRKAILRKEEGKKQQLGHFTTLY
jgi:hypothetical protein